MARSGSYGRFLNRSAHWRSLSFAIQYNNQASRFQGNVALLLRSIEVKESLTSIPGRLTRTNSDKTLATSGLFRNNNSLEMPLCQLGSGVEQRFRKAQVVGSNPTVGSIYLYYNPRHRRGLCFSRFIIGNRFLKSALPISIPPHTATFIHWFLPRSAPSPLL